MTNILRLRSEISRKALSYLGEILESELVEDGDHFRRRGVRPSHAKRPSNTADRRLLLSFHLPKPPYISLKYSDSHQENTESPVFGPVERMEETTAKEERLSCSQFCCTEGGTLHCVCSAGGHSIAPKTTSANAASASL